MPPEPSAEPACEAYMAAAALTSGSCAAYSLMVQCKALKNSGFSFRESGVGGLVVEVPIAREGVGGVFERKEYRYGRAVPSGCSWTYYDIMLAAIVYGTEPSLDYSQYACYWVKSTLRACRSQAQCAL
jgi:hypothetical protein